MREDEQPLSLEAIKRRLPPDLRQFLVFWQREVIQRYYADMPASAWTDSEINGAFWGVGPAAAYLPMVLFMQQNRAYDFAWVVEDDNRFIGDWGLFLTAALEVAAASGNASQLAEGVASGFDTFPELALPATEALPDFVAFNAINEGSDKWAATAHRLDPPFAESFLMVWGASRTLFDAMHARSLAGAFAYYETFMPTVALAEGLRLVSLPIDKETFGCCSESARHLYNAWYRNRLCQGLGLLHPIKLGDEWW